MSTLFGFILFFYFLGFLVLTTLQFADEVVHPIHRKVDVWKAAFKILLWPFFGIVWCIESYSDLR